MGRPRHATGFMAGGLDTRYHTKYQYPPQDEGATPGTGAGVIEHGSGECQS